MKAASLFVISLMLKVDSLQGSVTTCMYSGHYTLLACADCSLTACLSS